MAKCFNFPIGGFFKQDNVDFYLDNDFNIKIYNQLEIDEAPFGGVVYPLNITALDFFNLLYSKYYEAYRYFEFYKSFEIWTYQNLHIVSNDYSLIIADYLFDVLRELFWNLKEDNIIPKLTYDMFDGIVNGFVLDLGESGYRKILYGQLQSSNILDITKFDKEIQRSLKSKYPNYEFVDSLGNDDGIENKKSASLENSTCIIISNNFDSVDRTLGKDAIFKTEKDFNIVLDALKSFFEQTEMINLENPIKLKLRTKTKFSCAIGQIYKELGEGELSKEYKLINWINQNIKDFKTDSQKQIIKAIQR